MNPDTHKNEIDALKWKVPLAELLDKLKRCEGLIPWFEKIEET